MADDLEQQGDEAPAAMQPAESVEPVGDVELQRLLEEYDSQIEQPAEPEAVEDHHPFADSDDDSDAIDAILREHEEPVPPDPADAPGGASGVSDLDLLRQWAHGVDRERLQAREKADLDNVLALAKSELSDLPGVPGNFSERFLFSEYQTDSRFRQAWDSRYQDDASFARAERMMDKKFRAMRKEAASLPDPRLSADRELVIQSMKAGSQAAPPPPKAPDYASLDNEAFANEVQKLTGVRPLQ